MYANLMTTFTRGLGAWENSTPLANPKSELTISRHGKKQFHKIL